MNENIIHRSKKLSIEISGGLGNQLFQIAALESFALDHNLKPVINLSKISTGSMPRNFEVPTDLLEVLIPEKLVYEINNRFIIWYKKIVWNIESIFPKVKIRNIYLAKGIGFDPGPGSQFNSKAISGYFQSFRYPEKLEWRDKFKKFTPKGTKFSSLKKEMLQADPIVIHIRGKDYITDKSGVGNLGSSYFSNAIKNANSSNQAVWVFTDDVEHAYRILGPMKINYLIIDRYNDLSAIETIYLIAAAKKIIISNSTFAWWAAYISSNAQVYAPKKWFKEKDDPIDLIPANWHCLDSVWTT
jgi:hypothetical protein